jgi:hypothetical protein
MNIKKFPMHLVRMNQMQRAKKQAIQLNEETKNTIKSAEQLKNKLAKKLKEQKIKEHLRGLK